MRIGGNNRGKPSILKMTKGITKLFLVDSYVLFPVESISAMYIFVLSIINEKSRIFGTLAEITGPNMLIIQLIMHNTNMYIAEIDSTEQNT